MTSTDSSRTSAGSPTQWQAEGVSHPGQRNNERLGGGAVRLDRVVKRFGSTTAVAGIDLDIESGEFFSLLGASGCGKTTTLRMIAGFERPDEGKVLLDGRDMSGTPPHRRPVNTVFQAYALFPFLSVAENVAFGLRYQKASKFESTRRVNEALALTGLTDFAD